MTEWIQIKTTELLSRFQPERYVIEYVAADVGVGRTNRRERGGRGQWVGLDQIETSPCIRVYRYEVYCDDELYNTDDENKNEDGQE